MKIYVHITTFIWMFITAFFVVAKTGRNCGIFIKFDITQQQKRQTTDLCNIE